MTSPGSGSHAGPGFAARRVRAKVEIPHRGLPGGWSSDSSANSGSLNSGSSLSSGWHSIRGSVSSGSTSDTAVGRPSRRTRQVPDSVLAHVASLMARAESTSTSSEHDTFEEGGSGIHDGSGHQGHQPNGHGGAQDCAQAPGTAASAQGPQVRLSKAAEPIDSQVRDFLNKLDTVDPDPEQNEAVRTSAGPRSTHRRHARGRRPSQPEGDPPARDAAAAVEANPGASVSSRCYKGDAAAAVDPGASAWSRCFELVSTLGLGDRSSSDVRAGHRRPRRAPP